MASIFTSVNNQFKQLNRKKYLIEAKLLTQREKQFSLLLSDTIIMSLSNGKQITNNKTKTAMKTQIETEENQAKDQAQVQIESIVKMVLGLQNEDDDARQLAQDTIQEDALSVEVRGDWHTPGDKEAGNQSEYKILLCTGGPAVQIIGELSQHNEPETATVQFQDWGTPWTDYRETTTEQDEAILAYAQQFYFDN